MITTYTNGGITIKKDYIFSWVILTERGFLPITSFCRSDLKRFIDVIKSSVFPDELREFIKDRIKCITDEEDKDLLCVL